MKPFILLPLLLLIACDRAPSSPSTVSDAPGTTATLSAQPWALPTPAGAAQPDLVALDDGRVLLSWIEPDGDGHALRFAQWRDGAWAATRTIARGDDWFVNWADTPHLRTTPDGALWAHWLRKSAAAPYAYDVVLSRSGDDGVTWSAPLAVNDDGTPTEHGFVSMWPAARDRLGIAWLDGRRTGGGHDGHAAGHAGHEADSATMMTLRSAVFDATLARHDEVELDTSVCDCCQTDAALTARGPLLVYRDRTRDEIRDIHATRRTGSAWTRPQAVHDDGWRMPACPVNGPAVAANGTQAVVGWYTASDDTPTLKIALSTDSGDRFAAPRTVDRGPHVQGRIDVTLQPQAATALWLREDPRGQSLWITRWSADLNRELQRVELARLQGRGRGTGFPKLAAQRDGAYVVWVDTRAGEPHMQGIRLVP